MTLKDNFLSFLLKNMLDTCLSLYFGEALCLDIFWGNHLKSNSSLRNVRSLSRRELQAKGKYQDLFLEAATNVDVDVVDTVPLEILFKPFWKPLKQLSLQMQQNIKQNDKTQKDQRVNSDKHIIKINKEHVIWKTNT